MSTPSISIVTPSFNQSMFLEATLKSVLEGTVAPDEYIVADGGSTDGSVEILERWSPRLTAWWSKRDAGQYDAVNRALGQTTGDVMGWLNSDDLYMPWTLAIVQDIFRTFPEVEWLTTLYPLTLDAGGRVVMCAYTGGFDRASFKTGANLPHSQGYWRGVQQESTFWRRSLWEKADGYVDGSLRAAGDFELWSRFVEHADLVGIESPLGAFRSHGDQKTVHLARTYHQEGLGVLEQHGWNQNAGGSTRLRSALSKAVGRRSLKRLPLRLGSALVRGRVLRKTRVVAWTDGGWKLFDDYVA